MKLLSYDRNVFPHQFERDLDLIGSLGFDSVMLSLSEEDFMNFRDGVASLIEVAKQYSFDVWVNPLGVGNNFGLGRFSGLLQRYPEVRRKNQEGEFVNHACPSNHIYINYLVDWVKFVAETGADYLFWDEPNTGMCYCGTCIYDQMLTLITSLSALSVSFGMKNSFCIHCMDWNPDRDRTLLMKAARIAQIHDISLSMVPGSYANFDEKLAPYTAVWAREAVQTTQEYGKTVSMWLQSYDIPAGKEDSIRRAMKEAQRQGITNFCSWGFMGNVGSGVACGNPVEAWKEIGIAFGGKNESTYR